MNTEAYEEYGYSTKYPQMSFAHWQALHDCISSILAAHRIIAVDPFNGVILDPILEKSHDCSHSPTVALAKAVLSDVFREKLHRVFPEIRYDEDNIPQSAWRIPTLLDAMYLEIFFRFSPNGVIKKCANQTCNNYFEWSKSTPTKIYCSQRCAMLMAKRKQREREKKH